MKFLKLTVKNYIIMHGFDSMNKQILEEVEVGTAIIKLFAIDTILSISKKNLITIFGDRLIYWDYVESFEVVMRELEKNNLALIVKDV